LFCNKQRRFVEQNAANGKLSNFSLSQKRAQTMFFWISCKVSIENYTATFIW